jgi:hypothetical protein
MGKGNGRGEYDLNNNNTHCLVYSPTPLTPHRRESTLLKVYNCPILIMAAALLHFACICLVFCQNRKLLNNSSFIYSFPKDDTN